MNPAIRFAAALWDVVAGQRPDEIALRRLGRAFYRGEHAGQHPNRASTLGRTRLRDDAPPDSSEESRVYEDAHEASVSARLTRQASKTRYAPSSVWIVAKTM